MDMTLYALSKKYAESLSLGFTRIEDLGNGKIRFVLTDNESQYLDVDIPTIRGISPTITTSKSGKIATVSVTDIDGIQTFQISDGADGGMSESIYDPQNKATDIFAYVDEKTASGGALQFSVEGVVVDD